ncbi:hypothetical protein B0T24DRAFT_666249 [Lasiosphaeria ovina]|uniref:Uncharacterized protein n=1 Tax=Lasiosphaeria ovina TaxID=92902 RepID=A0AAE0KBI8_9PEZI|nr:hypothetical protein B0T24DRAFT_666249 [Lasiosphaeria ovina]
MWKRDVPARAGSQTATTIPKKDGAAANIARPQPETKLSLGDKFNLLLNKEATDELEAAKRQQNIVKQANNASKIREDPKAVAEAKKPEARLREPEPVKQWRSDRERGRAREVATWNKHVQDIEARNGVRGTVPPLTEEERNSYINAQKLVRRAMEGIQMEMESDDNMSTEQVLAAIAKEKIAKEKAKLTSGEASKKAVVVNPNVAHDTGTK